MAAYSTLRMSVRVLATRAVVALNSVVLAVGVGVSPAAAQAPELAPPALPRLENDVPPPAPGGPAVLGGEVAAGDGLQVLDRGPIHEAFAEPMVDPGMHQDVGKALVPREPPEPINELPPEVRPDGANVIWIPGYWMWSPDQNDFAWVSGVWRNAPPGRRWVPGHWSPLEEGFVWSPGFWVGEEAAEIVYLPTPPQSLEQGPSSPAPSDNHFWIPGCWIYQNNAYAWRAGYWYVGQPNWVWVPSYYAYTPRGFVYVSGFWDRPIVRRGFLYASVYWRSPLYLRPGFVYRPRAVVNINLLTVNLFVNPYRHHYFYGGFGPSFVNLGFYPWHAYHRRGPGFYDPLFAYHRWHDGRHNHNWHANLEQQYRRFDQWDRAGDGQRRGGPRPGGADIVLANHRQLADHGLNVATRATTATERAKISGNIEQWRGFEKQRIAAETSLTGDVSSRIRAGKPALEADGQVRNRTTLGDAPARVDGVPRSGEAARDLARNATTKRNIATTPGATGRLKLDGGAGDALPGPDRQAGSRPGVSRSGFAGGGQANSSIGTTGPGSAIGGDSNAQVRSGGNVDGSRRVISGGGQIGLGQGNANGNAGNTGGANGAPQRQVAPGRSYRYQPSTGGAVETAPGGNAVPRLQGTYRGNVEVNPGIGAPSQSFRRNVTPGQSMPSGSWQPSMRQAPGPGSAPRIQSGGGQNVIQGTPSYRPQARGSFAPSGGGGGANMRSFTPQGNAGGQGAAQLRSGGGGGGGGNAIRGGGGGGGGGRRGR
ncbi:MAG: YXWGXW repeat-containing protein [Pirellulales bacterium]|nr:YXWGXW repeat-containing protein [Pirellulales bacterium]